MLIEIDRKASTPVYLQIKEQIISLIKSGMLSPGEELPSSRRLATELGVSRKTILQSYLELSAEGWISSVPGSKTVVSSVLPGEEIHKVKPVWQEVEKAPKLPKKADMNWERYFFNGENFAIPRYYEKWDGPEPYISFAKALPDPKQFPFGRIKKIVSQLLWNPKGFFFDRGHPQGYQPLVEYLEHTLARDKIDMRPGVNEIVICSGFQVALNLLLTLVIRYGETVYVENPTYASILNALIARGIPHVGIPVEQDGMDIDFLEKRLKKDRAKAGAVITVPTLQNPTGTLMSRQKREALIYLAQRYELPIIEDAYAFFMRLETERPPTLKAFDAGGHVFLVGSFSKSFLPGLRIGFICTPGKVATSLVKLKRALDQSDSFFLQTILLEFIEKGFMDLHLRKMARIYRERMEVMAGALEENFPKDFRWQKPYGGLSIWVEMPRTMRSKPLLEYTVKKGVDFAPASLFFVGKKDSNHLRLAFSQVSQDEIREGIKRLGYAIRTFRKDVGR